MHKIIFIICLGIFASKDGTAFYENLYTDTIYDQTDLPEPYTKEQAIDLLNQHKSKMIEDIILPQLRQELSEKQSILRYFHWKRFFISAIIGSTTKIFPLFLKFLIRQQKHSTALILIWI
jgi:hypothetical protein